MKRTHRNNENARAINRHLFIPVTLKISREGKVKEADKTVAERKQSRGYIRNSLEAYRNVWRVKS